MIETIRQLKYINDSIWYYYSVFGCLPLIAITFMKYRQNVPYHKYLNKTLPKDSYDLIAYALIFYSTYYYLIDTLFKFTGIKIIHKKIHSLIIDGYE